MRITAAVYEALRSILNEMSQRIEQFDMRLSALNESMRDDFNSTANMICDKIEEHDNQITTELMKMNENLTEQIINNSGGWSSSLSVEDHTVRCVVGSEPTSGDCQMPSRGIIMMDKLQLTVPMSVVSLGLDYWHSESVLRCSGV